MLDKIKSWFDGDYIIRHYDRGSQKKIWVDGEEKLLKGDGKLEDFMVERMEQNPQLAEKGLVTDILDPRLKNLLINRGELADRLKTRGKVEVQRPKNREACKEQQEREAQNPEAALKLKCHRKKVVYRGEMPESAGFLAGWQMQYEENIDKEPNYGMEILIYDSVAEYYRTNRLTLSNRADDENFNEIVITDRHHLDEITRTEKEDGHSYRVELRGENGKGLQKISSCFFPKEGEVFEPFLKETIICDKNWKEPRKTKKTN